MSSPLSSILATSDIRFGISADGGGVELCRANVFAIVSIHNMPILDAINRLGKTKIIDVGHEQAGTHAADGYARASGKLGVMKIVRHEQAGSSRAGHIQYRHRFV